MNYSKFHSNSLSNNQQIRVDIPTILICVPDSNVLMHTALYETKFTLTNCLGLIVPNSVVTIQRKRFNGLKYYTDIKKEFMKIPEEVDSGKRFNIIPVSNLYNSEENKKTNDIRENENKFYFYDGTILANGIQYTFDKFNVRTGIFTLFKELDNIYKELKHIKPIFNIDVMFLMKDSGGYLNQILDNYMLITGNKNISEELKVFDNYLFVNNLNGVTIPIMDHVDAKLNVVRNNLNKVKNFLGEVIKEEPVTTKEEQAPSEDTKKIAESVDKAKIKTDSVLLRKVMNVFQIKDPDVIANVKTAIDTYKQVKNINPDQSTIENVALRAINYTVHGTDEIKEEYLTNPASLFSKLKEINTYKVPLKFPENKNILIKPQDVIDIKYTTGQHRQKFEFEEAIHDNVRKLFSSLEQTTAYPVKVTDMKWEIKDDNANRYIDYNVTLENINGGLKEPYTVNLKVPSPVNDRYFKLHNSMYIISSQQFLKPLTKTDKNEVRILSNYAIIRLSIQNLKFNPADIDDLVRYIKLKYPQLIKNTDNNQLVFSDKSVIHLIGNLILENGDDVIKIDEDTNKIVDKNGEVINLGKYEFIFQYILTKIHKINPTDNLTKSKKAIPYFQLYLSKITIPLVLYLWSQKGLLSTLNSFGVNYEITDSIGTGDTVSIPTKNKQFLVIKPETLKQKLLVNGLLVYKIKDPINDLNDHEAIYNHIISIYGPKGIYLINLMTENEIDPITKELLEFENMPTNLPGLLSSSAVDKLLNGQLESLSDLKIYRSRLSELILQTTYKQLKMAHNYYRNKVMRYNDSSAKIVLDPDYVIKNLLTDAGFLQNCNTVNPVDELMLSSRIIKSGSGGAKN